jgi:hypothetical protein
MDFVNRAGADSAELEAFDGAVERIDSELSLELFVEDVAELDGGEDDLLDVCSCLD